MLNTGRLHSLINNEFVLVQHYKWSRSELNEMLPFELDIHIEKLNAYLEKVKQREQNGS